jgi:hypothetical protein
VAFGRDFREFKFDPIRIDDSGKFVGRRVYWKLYCVENLIRVFIHSVLSVQINPDWWDIAVDPKIRKRAESFRQQYIQRPWHTIPGQHGIYYVFLSDLNNILRANSNLLLPLVPEIDEWMTRIEGIRLPRNIVSHMNFPNQPDCRRIDEVYSQIPALLAHLLHSGLEIRIP